MESNQTAKNKELLRNLYEDIMNNRKLDQITGDLVSDEFVNVQGTKGPEGFKQQIQALFKGFPDAHWKLDEIIAEGNKVMIRQTFTGTHLGQFQFYEPTGKKLSNTGIAVYEFNSGGKIAKATIDTDRLSFLQQMGLIPQDLKLLLNKKSGSAVAQ